METQTGATETMGNMPPLTITQSAANHINKVKTDQANENMFLRIAVQAGGCSGYRYILGMDEQIEEGDLKFERDGASIVIDTMSYELLAGCEIDFIESLEGSAFKISNPNASSGCGCGRSFNT